MNRLSYRSAATLGIVCLGVRAFFAAYIDSPELLGAGWLARRFSLGPWVYFAAIVLGLGAAACTFAEFVKMFRRKNGKK